MVGRHRLHIFVGFHRHRHIISLGNRHQAHIDRLDDGLRRNAVVLVVFHLHATPTVGLFDGSPHAVGHDVGVENRTAFQMARRPAHGLDERTARPQKSFLVRIQNRHQRNLRQIQALAQQVDPDQHVELAAAQVAQYLDPVERLNF